MLLTPSIKVVMLGYTAESLEIGDLPIVSFDMRATHLFRRMRNAMKNVKPVIFGWKPKPGSGWQIGIRLFKLNSLIILSQISLSAVAAVLFYVPAFFLRRLVAYLEADPERLHRGWGVVFALGLFVSGVTQTLGGCLHPKSIQARVLNTILQRPANFGLSVPRLFKSGYACSSIPSCLPRRWFERTSLPPGRIAQREARRMAHPPKKTLKRRTMTFPQRHRL